MPWLSIDDKFHANPKVMAAGNAAVGLYVRCVSYCADQLTDGFVPDVVARMYGTKREIDTLLANCPPYGAMWVRVDGGYQIPDYLQYNPTREEVLEDRRAKHEAKVKAGRLGGIASGVTRRKAQPKQNGSNGEANAEQIEAPSPPLPSPSYISSVKPNITSEVPDLLACKFSRMEET